MEAASLSTSSSLLRQVQRNAPQAWDRFAALYVPLVYAWTQCLGLQPHDAADVCQNVFVSVMRGLPAFRLEAAGGGLRAWLRTITKHAVIDWHRKQGREPPAQQLLAWDDLAEASSQSHSAEDIGRNLLVQRATEQLKTEFEPQTWQSFWQLCVEGRSAAEIAAERQVSVWAIYKAKARVLARFRELLGDYE